MVTGASSGIGRAVAIAFAREGASVLVTYRQNAAVAAETVREIESGGGRAEAIPADISLETDVAHLTAEAFGRGKVDIWVNNAGADILTGEGARRGDLEKLDLVLGVDLRGTVMCSWAVAERLRAQGRGVILNVSWDHVLT